MALTQQEREIVNQLKTQGKSDTQIMSYISGQRTGRPSSISLQSETTNSNPISGLQETLGDVVETAKNVGQTVSTAAQGVSTAVSDSVSGDRNPILAGFDAAGSVAGGIGNLAGDAILGAGKVLTSGENEEAIANQVAGAIQPIVESEEVQSLIQGYEGLDDDTKQNLRTTGNLGMALFDILTLGGGSKLVQPAKQAVTKALTGATRLADEAAEGLGKTAQQVVSKGKELKPTFGKVASIEDPILRDKAQIRVDAEANAPDISFTEKAIGLTKSDKAQIIGKTDKMQDYIDVVQTRNTTTNAPSAMEFGGDQVRKASEEMGNLLNSKGSDIGQTRAKLSSVKASVDGVAQTENTFKAQLNKLGLEINNKGRVVRQSGVVSRVGTNADIKAMNNLWKEFQIVKQSPTVTNLLDYRNLVQKNIDFGKSSQKLSDALNNPSKEIRVEIKNALNDIVGKSGAQDLEDYTNFINAYNDIKSFTDRSAGGEYLLRVLESGRGGEARAVVNTIKKYTGIDLQDDATMMRLVTELLADQSQKTQFTQQITNAGLDTSRILAGDKAKLGEKIFGGAMNKIAEPEKVLIQATRSFNQGATPSSGNLLKRFSDRVKNTPNKEGGFVKVGKSSKLKQAETIIPKDIKIYRGEGAGIGNATFVKGKYFTDNKKMAQTFGDDITEIILPAKTKVFDFDVLKKDIANQDIIPQELLVDPDGLTQFLKSEGYTATKNTTARGGVEYVFFDGKLPAQYEVSGRKGAYDVVDRNNHKMFKRFANKEDAIKAQKLLKNGKTPEEVRTLIK